MNTNMIHNILNALIAIIAALAALDWHSFLNPATAAAIVAGLSGAKILMNVVRDGFAGLFKVQPPVTK
jgi:flagellar motor component MotA